MNPAPRRLHQRSASKSAYAHQSQHGNLGVMSPLLVAEIPRRFLDGAEPLPLMPCGPRRLFATLKANPPRLVIHDVIALSVLLSSTSPDRYVL